MVLGDNIKHGVGRLASPRVVWIWLILAMAGHSASAEVKVVGKVLHAGFPSGGIDFYRPGCWCPVVASLQNVGDEHLAGRLVLQQRDKDGDVMVAETVLSLTAGGEARTYRLDFVANAPNSSGVFVVRLYDEDGKPVPVFDDKGTSHEYLPAPQAAPVNDGVSLVLDLSTRPIASLDTFADDSAELLVQRIDVVRFRPEHLPDRWYTLQAVQAIIWDAPAIGRLDAQQIRALIDYVRAGGILVLAAGRTASDLNGSSLGEVLPVTINGTTPAESLYTVWNELLRGQGDGTTPPTYSPPIGVARARAKPGAVPICSQDGLEIDVVTRGRVGSGLVVFVAAELKDLFRVGSDKRRFFKQVLGLIDAPAKSTDRSSFVRNCDLYDYMHGAIGFEGLSGSFLVFVVLFVAGYILTATLATWWWLHRRGALQHCWLVFAAVAIVGSVLSVGAVQVIRGVGTDVRQMSIIDVTVPPANKGPFEARAATYFGLKSAVHAYYDVRMASSQQDNGTAGFRNYLQPLPAGQTENAAGYVAPERYNLRGGLAMMEAVPVRATLKRLQGYWFGRLEGSFSAMIEMDTAGRLSDRSWIRNDLGVALHDCWLITPATSRIGGMTRATRIYVHQIGQTIRSGDGPIQVSRSQNQDKTKWPRLEDMHKRWIRRFAPLGNPGRMLTRERMKFDMAQFPTALMLLTTMDEYHMDLVSDGRMKVELERTHGLNVDRCHLLTNETVMVVGFADDPGPARIEVRPGGKQNASWRRLDPGDPAASRTMYRFIVPVHRIARRQEDPW